MQQGLRYQHATLQGPALRLDARRDVHGVAAVNDVLLDVADLSRDDGTAVEARLELGHDAVSGTVSIPLLVNALADQKHAAKTVALAKSAFDRPRHHRLVADVLVNLPSRLQHRLREIVEEVVLEIVEAQRSQRFRGRRGVVQIQEHKDALLSDGPVVAAQYEAEQPTGAQHPIELPHEVDQEARQREDREGHCESAAQHESPVLLGRVVREQSAVLGETEQASRHGVDHNGAQDDVEEGPHEEEAAHRQGTHDARDQPELEPRATEPYYRSRRNGGEFARGVSRHPPYDPVNEQRRNDPATGDPERGSYSANGPARDHGSGLMGPIRPLPPTQPSGSGRSN